MTPAKSFGEEFIQVGKILLAGTGGFIGSALRYLIAGWVQQTTRSATFPFGTLAVNLIGCLAIGALSYLAETRGLFTAETRTLVFIGVLGGFTTFSAFGNETMNLWRDGESALALANVTAHLVLCLGAVWLSRVVAFEIWR
jgi:fluoride exporter